MERCQSYGRILPIMGMLTILFLYNIEGVCMLVLVHLASGPNLSKFAKKMALKKAAPAFLVGHS
jgi:hypothetical protein